VRLVFRVSATRSASIEEEGERALFPPSRSFSSHSAFSTHSLLLARTYCVRRALWRGQRGLLQTPACSPCPSLLLPFPTGTSTERPSVPGRDPPKRRQLLQKTGAARRIIILLYCHRRPLLLHHLLLCSKHPS